MTDQLSEVEQYQVGDPEAWNSTERDGFLQQSFLPVRQFREISARDMSYLCGRRGTGKSAIAIKLGESDRYVYRKAIQGEHDQYGAYLDIVRRLDQARQSRHPNIDIKRSINRLWSWALPVVAMQLIWETDGTDAEPGTDVATIGNYLSELPKPLHALSTIGQLLEVQFLEALKRLDVGEFESFLLNLTNDLEFISATIALERITRRNNALIVLDTLESYQIYSPLMLDGFRGILEAISTFRADAKMSGISLKLFLPAEIFEKITSEIPAKTIARTVFMRWRAADIVALIAGRYLALLERVDGVSNVDLRHVGQLVHRAYEHQDGTGLRQEFWYETGFLPKRIHNALDQEEDCLAYMFRHTFRRPRDSIMQLQAIVDNAVERDELPYISEESVKKGVHNQNVLSSILGDALSPFEGTVPIEVLSAARSTFYRRPWIMSGLELRRFAKDLYALHPFADIDLDEFAQLMLRAGCIGLLRSEFPQETYRTARFEYMMPETLPFRNNLDYCVHPVVGDLFHMGNPEDGRAIYPLPEHDPWLEEQAKLW